MLWWTLLDFNYFFLPALVQTNDDQSFCFFVSTWCHRDSRSAPLYTWQSGCCFDSWVNIDHQPRGEQSCRSSWEEDHQKTIISDKHTHLKQKTSTTLSIMWWLISGMWLGFILILYINHCCEAEAQENQNFSNYYQKKRRRKKKKMLF